MKISNERALPPVQGKPSRRVPLGMVAITSNAQRTLDHAEVMMALQVTHWAHLPEGPR